MNLSKQHRIFIFFNVRDHWKESNNGDGDGDSRDGGDEADGGRGGVGEGRSLPPPSLRPNCAALIKSDLILN